MKYCRIVYSGEPYLAHHGIDGQKWGVRNGPPYPLDRETHIKVVREGYVKKRAEIPTGRVKTIGLIHTRFSTIDRQWGTVFKDKSGNYVNYAQVIGKNPDAYKTERDMQSSIDSLTKTIGDFYKDPKYEDLDDSEKREKMQSLKSNLSSKIEEQIEYMTKSVNPQYDRSEPGTYKNCAKCTATMALKMMGFNDVTAGRSFAGTYDTGLSYWFDGATQYTERGLDNAAKRLDKVLGNNGYGELACKYPSGGGHSMFVKKVGNDYILSEGQTGNVISTIGTGQTSTDFLKTIQDEYGFDLDDRVLITRLDTATPNWNNLAEDSVISKLGTDTGVMMRKTDGTTGHTEVFRKNYYQPDDVGIRWDNKK